MTTASNDDAGVPLPPLVVVTGGSGLIGSALIRRLAEHGHRVVSLDLAGDPTSPPSVEFICTDLTSDDSVRRAIARVVDLHGHHVASVVHLAAFYDFAGRESPLYDEVTVEGTRRLLDVLADVRLDQFVFSSTMLVHRPGALGDPIDEDDPIEGSWPYPASKVATEQVVRQHPTASSSRIVLARIAGVYDEAGHSPPITNQIKRIDGRWPTSRFYPADPDLGQAFVHRDDVVDALFRIVERRGDLPDPFPVLIGEPTTVGYGELQDAIGRALYGHDWTTWQIPAPLAKVGAWIREQNPIGADPFIRSWMVDRAADHYELDIGAARDHLGWEPRRDVCSTIPAMIDRLRADRDGWYAANDLRVPHRLLPAWP